MRKVLVPLFVGLFVLASLLWFGGRWVLSLSVADYDGKIPVEVVDSPVDITFDAKGIPQIWAQTDKDMFAALGWVHASERLFQMTLLRRLAAGKLSEIFGKSTFDMDLFQRKIGFARKAANDVHDLSADDLTLLQSYCNGINAWIHSKKILPPEFVVLRLTPRDWRPQDCLAVLLYQTWFSHALMDRDRKFSKLIETFGKDVEKAILAYKQWSPPTVDDGALQSLFQDTSFPMQITNASNSWVVAPERSASGQALHASDPHLLINQIPAPWYLVGMHSEEGTNVLGVTAPGIPFVAMGHNENVAYAFTVASVDIIDYTREDVPVGNRLQVKTSRGPEDMHVLHESIQVKGESQPRQAEILTTSRGVVIERDSTTVLSLKWAGFDFSAAQIVHSGMALHRVEDFEHFRKLVTALGALDANWTYSDKNGNIGYQLGVPIPKRLIKDTYMERKGEDAQSKWQGYVPFDKTPFSFNPVKGWLATCNNQIVPEPWLKDLPGFYDPYRITRAVTWLSEKEQYGLKDFETMQMDRISGVALRWKELCAEGADKLGNVELASELRKWNGAMVVENHTAAIFDLWWIFISKALFEDDLEENWRDGSIIKEEVLTENVTPVIDNMKTPDVVETPVDISAMALDVALKKAQNKTYGDISQLLVVHPLSRMKILDAWLSLNRGPFANGGDNGSLNSNFQSYDPKSGIFKTVAGPSMRYLLDWSDVDGFTMNINFGQSGNPFSPHYDDFFEFNREGRRWTVPFSKTNVSAKSVSVLTLQPDRS